LENTANRMDAIPKREQDRAFLQEQIVEANRKIARLRSMLASCRDTLEQQELTAMLQTAQLEGDLLNNLLAGQDKVNALSLDAIIADQSRRFQQQAVRLSRGWRRGTATPAGYWEAEARRSFLTDLLRRYHAWQAGRPYYAESQTHAAAPDSSTNNTSNGKRPPTNQDTHTYMHPWFLPATLGQNGNGGEDESHDEVTRLNVLRDAILKQLSQKGFPAGHLDLIIQPDGLVIAKGYAHNRAEHDQVIEVMCSIPAIKETLIDVQIVNPANCPACAAEGASNRV
jgi:hypothetical protein